MAAAYVGRAPSITKTERPRSANLLRMPTGLMCKLRQRGRGSGGRPAGSRGIDASLQPHPCGGRWPVTRTVTFPLIRAHKKAIDDHGGSRFAPNQGGTSPIPRMYAHFKLWPFYKAFSTLNARSPLFAGTIRNLSLAPSKMLRHLCPFTEPTASVQSTPRPPTR
jgi:hypothetical protein